MNEKSKRNGEPENEKRKRKKKIRRTVKRIRT